MERFFLIISRINSVLFLAVLLAICAAVTFFVGSDNYWRSRREIAVPVNPGTADRQMAYLSIGSIEDVPGSHTQILELAARHTLGKFSSGGDGGETRNVLFLSKGEKKPRWLFEKNSNVIADLAQLPPSYERAKEAPTKALAFEVITRDSNGDGKLTNDDDLTVALSRPDGTAYTELLHGVSKVISKKLIGNTEVGIVYQQGAKIRYSRYALGTFAKLGDQVVTQVPERF